MKRVSGSSDSLGTLMSFCPSTEEVEECGGQVEEKKRRLSVEQVKALEKQFEEENKVDPERKVKVAHQLGLHPRQVAVWFQNRRARSKTKILERDYGLLKATYDSLHLNFESLEQENQTLINKIKELKSKVKEKNKVEEAKEPKQQVKSDSDSSTILNSEHNSSRMLFNLPEYSIADDNIQFVKMEDQNWFGEEGCNFFLEDQAPTLHWYCWT